ncbi:hypothetical protein [Streptomyces melanogenes]|uniref:hypothetical protein n=1 Tax=Streptomyces melanogenes TaxID=67326 RepID=UPI003795D087
MKLRPSLFPAVLAGGAALVGGVVCAVIPAYATDADADARSAAVPMADLHFAVEDFEYPNADGIHQEKKLRLKRGDGRIQLDTACQETDGEVRVASGGAPGSFCLRASGGGGFLTMDVPDVRTVKTKDYKLTLVMAVDGKKQTVEIPANSSKPFGDGKRPHTLLEIRAAR